MKIAIIVAMAQDRAIGRNNELLWHLSSDLKRFKSLTTGHPIIMGRKTYQSLPNGALPNRRNIVISRSLDSLEGAEVVRSLDEALEVCSHWDRVFIIGGGEIYKQSLERANELHITMVEAEYPDADTFFPQLKLEDWVLKISEIVEPDERNPLRSTYYYYTRKD